MPLTRENSLLYEVIKVGTVSGKPLAITGSTVITSGTVQISGTTAITGSTVITSGTVQISGTTITGGRLQTETLGIPAVARVITISTGNTNTALTTSVSRISMRAAGTNAFYSVGSGSQTATLSGHFIANGERLDVNVPSGSPNIAVICASGSSGVLYVSELG